MNSIRWGIKPMKVNAIGKTLGLMAVTTLISLGGCGSPNLNSSSNINNKPAQSSVSSATPTLQSTPQTSTPALNSELAQSTKPRVTKTVMVTVYQIDGQCQAFLPQKIAVPVDHPIQAAVGEVLDQQSSGDFELSGYRVDVDPERQEATVDLRLAPNSKRRFTALSNCEQLAIFGSLRKTLTSNVQWKIQSTRFTEQGQEITF